MLKKLIKTLIFGIGVLYILSFSINKLENLKEVDSTKDLFDNVVKEKQEFKTGIKHDENELLEMIEKGLLEAKDSIEIPQELIEDDPDQLFHMVEKATISNPEIMYYTGGRYTKGLLYFEYSKPIEEIKLHQDIVRKKRDQIISNNIKADMLDYQKVKIIHDYVINTTKYDGRYINDEVPEESHSVYGVLEEGLALCGGYAKTMKYLLDAAEIETMVVIGKTDHGNHAWNIINIDGYYYHIDTTWDDPVTEDGSDILSYEYFNLKDEDIEKTHSWNRSDYPKCNSNKYNYYYYNDLVVNDYDSFYNKIEKALWNKDQVCEMKILNFDEKKYNIPDVINSIVENTIQLILVKEFKYGINKEQGLIKIEFKYRK